MTQRIEQGSILGFVLVGALLTALVIGGIAVVRNQLAKNDSQVATDQSSQKSGSSSTGSSSDELKKALEQQQAEEKKAQEQKAASEAQQSQPASSSQGTTSNANNLPTTGPADAVWTILGAGLLAGTSMAYARSRSLN
jgi:hypothetical protein